MSEFQQKLEVLTSQAYPTWNEARARAVRHAAVRSFTRKRSLRQRSATAGLLLLASAGAAWLLLPSASHPEHVDADSSGDPERFLTFPGGARAELLNARAHVSLRRQAGEAVVELASGRVRFHAQERQNGAFHVVSHSVHIEVLSARFVVESRDDGTYVAVEQGQAHVRWAQGSVSLAAGTHGLFPPQESNEPAPAGEASPGPKKEPGSTAAATEKPARNWRRLAQGGRYRAAYVELQNEGPKAVRDEPADLLLAADVARLSGHAEQAIEPLERLIARHPSDVRAASAAFTLGKLLAEHMNEPARAARSFAQVRRLAAGGPLAQAALAREAEALHRAGRRQEAAALVQTYVRLYPQGPHLDGLRALDAAP